MATRFGSAPGQPETQPTTRPPAGGRLADSVCTVAGGLTVVAGAALSLTFTGRGPHHIGPAAAGAAMVFGLVLAGLGAALRSIPRRYAAPAAATALGLSVLGAATFALSGVRLFGAGALAHTSYTLAGFIMVPWLAPAEASTLAHYASSAGTVVAVGGCLIALIGALGACQHRR
jgi:hypothetical protein